MGKGAYGCMGLGGRGGPGYWFICKGATGWDDTCSSWCILCMVKPQMIPFSTLAQVRTCYEESTP